MTLIDKAEALLPCPFCGSTDLYFPHGTDPAVIECSGCGARSGVPDEQTEAEAIAAWNRRAAHPARGVGVPERVQHKKRGSTYRVVGRGKVQTDTPLTDYAEVVVYQCEAGGTVWVRPVSEFEDGRFAALAPTDAAQAPVEDAHAKGETAGQMLERLGMDGAKWAAEFRTTALRLGYSDMDEGWLIGWFCNAIMAGYDRAPTDAAQAREAALREAEKALRDWQDDLNANRMSETAVTVGMAADVVIDLIGEPRT